MKKKKLIKRLRKELMTSAERTRTLRDKLLCADASLRYLTQEDLREITDEMYYINEALRIKHDDLKG